MQLKFSMTEDEFKSYFRDIMTLFPFEGFDSSKAAVLLVAQSITNTSYWSRPRYVHPPWLEVEWDLSNFSQSLQTAWRGDLLNKAIQLSARRI